MSTTFESAIKTIAANEDEIFPVLSDLRNIEKLKDRIPQDKVKDMIFDEDSITCVVDPVGTVSLKIIEREPSKTIKFTADKSPINFFVWIQLKQVADKDTKIKITLKAELNPFIKGMASKPLEQFVNMLADVLSKLEYK
jgi:carbon monoxide dehydrogenase subunit G